MHPVSLPRPAVLVGVFGALLLSLLPLAARAHQPPAPVEAAARSFLDAETTGLPGEVTVDIGALDPANRLPPCDRLEAFLPSGARAWGQLNLGVRCVAPVAWTVYLPARVAVTMDYVVTARPVRPGQIIAPDDLRIERGDITLQPASVVTDPTRAVGQHARIAVAQGSPLRLDMLRLPPAIQQGQTVRVVGQGEGFQVMNEGRAMNRAGEGESVRVRLNNGQVVTGIARHGGVVELRF